MLEKVIVNYLKKNISLNNDQEQIVSFAIQLIESTVYSISSIVLVSLLFDNLKETMVVLVTAAVLRLAAGGAHCNTSLRCAVAGALIFPSLGLIVQYYQIHNFWALIVLIIIAFIAIAKYAPAEAKGKPLKNREYTKKMYKISIIITIIISSLALIYLPSKSYISTGLVTGLIWQAITITPFGFKLISGFDNLLYTLIRR